MKKLNQSSFLQNDVKQKFNSSKKTDSNEDQVVWLEIKYGLPHKFSLL